MAPIEVIDLTSSPEPEDASARAAALSRFKPRKEKIELGHAGQHRHATNPTPTISMNGLPLFYGNDVQRPQDLSTGRTLGAHGVPVGSCAPVAERGIADKTVEETAHGQNLYASLKRPLEEPGINGIPNGAPAVSPKLDSTVTPRALLAYGTAPPPLNRDRLPDERPTIAGAINGHRKSSTNGRGLHSMNEVGASGNGFSPDSSSSAYQHLVSIARPLDGISAECRTRLYEQRDSLAGTPLEHAIQQDILKTQSSHSGTDPMSASEPHSQRQRTTEANRFPCPMADQLGCPDMFSTAGHAARHAHVHTSEKNEICPNCGRSFLRKDNMEKHRKSCEARLKDMPSRSTASAQRPTPDLAGSDRAVLRGSPPRVISTEETFNMLKRSLPLSPSIQNGTAKRPRVDMTSFKPQELPLSRVQLTDMADTTKGSLVLSNESEDLPSDSTQLHSQLDGLATAHAADDLSGGPDRSGLPYSLEEDTLLKKLKMVYGLTWPAITARFSGRTQGSLQVRYSSLKAREFGAINAGSDPLELKSPVPAKRVRKANVASGMIPWASVKQARLAESQTVEMEREKRRLKRLREQCLGAQSLGGQEVDLESVRYSSPEDEDAVKPLLRDSAYPSSMSRILRLRELGLHGRRAWSANPRSVSDELKDHVFSDYGLQQDYHGASGDVISLAWNDCGRFAAGSIAITDQQSMQYNMHRNLLVGDARRGEIEELLHHHIPRPVIESATNVNAQHAMRESQDPRLFPSVVAAKFCPQDSTRLFTASMDKTLRHFTVEQESVTHRYAIKHTAPVSVLSVGDHGLVASGCHQSMENINVFKCGAQRHEVKLQLSARQTMVPTFPSALKWGVAQQHRNFLLAGFSGEQDVASTATGETCLWDASTGQQINLGSATRNVFDVAWNPIPSSSSITFAVAGNSIGHVVDKGMRSVIQCFAAGQWGGRGVLDWQCPALDVNDLVFCPYDDNLIAAGATNGRVYIWDKRSADRSQRPLHTLKHGESLNVLDHDRDAETADTGVQFLAWGPTKNRIYSGSSDGIVKIWNPYRAPNNAHIGDISTPSRDRVAIMSGAFSPDFQELLIGTENGRINHFKSGSGAVYSKPSQFKLRPAPAPESKQEKPFIAAHSLLNTGQVELKPCGGMPFRQAVQGPNYQGPFLEPTSTQWQDAEKRLAAAKLAQARLDDDNDGADFAKAAAVLHSADEGIADLQRRAYGALMAKPQAEAFQRKLAELEQARRELEALVGDVERCKLDCAVLPQPHGDNDEGVDDSGRSQLRIPSLLRYAANDAVVMGKDDSLPPCPRCTPGRLKDPSDGPCPLAACVLKRARMTSACANCGKPVLPGIEEGTSALCERCAFGCFRCGLSVVIDQDTRTVSCGPCGLEWEVGVLGYELVGSLPFGLDSGMEITKDEGEEDEWMSGLDGGDIEFHAGRWNVLRR